MQVFVRDKFRNQEIRQSRFSKGITQDQGLRPIAIQGALNLKRELSFPLGEDRVLFVVFAGSGEGGSPVGPAKIRIRVCQLGSAIQRTGQRTDGYRFRLPANVVA